MELILKKDNKTLEFVSGSQEINVNDDLVQIISVMPEMPLLVNESLWVAFEQNGTVVHTMPLFGDEGRYTTNIPQAMIDVGGEWEFQILRRRYQTSEHEGGFIQTASNKGAFTIGEGVKTVDGTLITTAMLTTLYREVVEDKAIIKEQVEEAITQAETAAEHAESAAASASTAQENAAIAGAYATAAEVSAQSILPKLDAAETAAASASESAANAMASAEKAEGAAVSAESAADAAVEKVSDLEKDIALLNTALMQGGITYKAETETAYNERITAGGLNVLDGSLAVLKKVRGNTVKCNNLIPFPYRIGTDFTMAGVHIKVNDDGSITLNGTCTEDIFFTLNAQPITLKQGKYYLSGNQNFANRTILIYTTGDTPLYKDGVITVSETATTGVNFAVYTGTVCNNVTIYPMLNEGETALPYQPYFEGLKNASFAGLESTNADGTEVSTLNFPKTELGEWDSIDFENKKGVVGTQTLVFNGTENWEVLNSYISLRNVPSIANANNGICNLYPYLYQFAGNCIFIAGSYLRVGTALGETFNNDVAKWKTHLAELDASGNPLIVAYELATPTETPFTAEQSASGNEYRAYSGGTERVLGNDNAEFGAKNTLLQNYIVVKE